MTDQVGHLSHGVVGDVAPAHFDSTFQAPSAEAGDQAVDHPQQGRLADPRRAYHQRQLPLAHVEIDPDQGGAVGVGIGERHAVEGDHCAASGIERREGTGGVGGAVTAGVAATRTEIAATGLSWGHVRGSRVGARTPVVVAAVT